MASSPATDLSVPYVSSVAVSAPVAVSTPAPQPAAEPVDTVELSEAAQVLQLSQEGQSASQIGSILGLTTAEVDSDLGETVAVILSTAATSEPTAPVANAPAH